MAASPLNSKSHIHARSNNLPSTSHPSVTEFEENLCRLRASETLFIIILIHSLSRLRDLHECVENFLLLPLTQQALAQECEDKWINELLDGSLRLLDVCGIIKDALLQTKECMHELQSIMHRRRELGKPKRVACEGEEVANTNELEKVDAALQSLVSHKSKKYDNTMQVEDVQIWLQDLEANIQDIEEGLECLFTHLIKTRVSLLNIFSH
ncbi:hypothetical protein PRUPE_2G076800 [Prunus persica]|uniref:Uncharacterized protein n=1 Tax=Prunus persica TaxID=3760 RepID=A0A251QCV7_PRUPE|nr:hypothetical protein PRUPE_2G076800 [Prunus persica]